MSRIDKGVLGIFHSMTHPPQFPLVPVLVHVFTKPSTIKQRRGASLPQREQPPCPALQLREDAGATMAAPPLRGVVTRWWGVGGHLKGRSSRCVRGDLAPCSCMHSGGEGGTRLCWMCPEVRTWTRQNLPYNQGYQEALEAPGGGRKIHKLYKRQADWSNSPTLFI